MLRVKIPGGVVSPAQLRAIGEISNVHGRGEGELTTRQNVQLHYLALEALPGRLRPAARSRAHLGRRVRRHGAQHHRLPGRRSRARRALRPDAGARGGGGILLRQPRLLGPAAEAQDRDHRVRGQLRGARDQLRRPRRRAPRGRGGVRRARRRWALVGAADRPRARHLGSEGRRGDRARGDPRRLARRSPLPRLARQGAAQVHGRRPRARRHARTGRATARPHVRRLPAAAGPAAGQPSRRARAARRPLLRRRAGSPRARHRRPADRTRRARARGADHPPAEPCR